MINTYSAYTCEAYEPQTAIKEVLDCLPSFDQLPKKCAAFVAASADFFNNGIVEAVCKALPFITIAYQTNINSDQSSPSEDHLGVLVIGGENLDFAAGMVRDNECDTELYIQKRMKAQARMTQPAKLAFVFGTWSQREDDVAYLSAVVEGAGELPLFGTLAIDLENNGTFCTTPMIALNGEVSHEGTVFLMMGGDFDFSFVASQLEESDLVDQKAVITAAHGCVLEEINGVAAAEFLRQVGYGDLSTLVGPNTNPIMVQRGEDEAMPIMVKALLEGGGLLLNSRISVGERITFGVFGIPAVTQTARTVCEQINAANGTAALIFSCLSRLLILNYDAFKEFDIAKETLNSSYMIAYSGGEICPTAQGKNACRNMTMIACVLK
jgi:hypothetical protein